MKEEMGTTKKTLSRREMLKMIGSAAAGMVALAACGPTQETTAPAAPVEEAGATAWPPPLGPE